MAQLLAVDQGTTSSRAIVFDADGREIATAQKEFRQIFPRAGWVEHDASEIWSTQADVMSEAMRRAGLRAGDLAGVGVTNQRETTVVWERATGEPIHNAIVWQDRRTAGMCDRLAADGAESVIRGKTGLVIDAYFSGTKVAWLLEHVPGARQKAERGELAFGTIDSWLLWRMTEGRLHATDATNASRTLLFNIHTQEWDDELLDLFGVPRSMLPDVIDTSAVVGETDAPLLGKPVPIAGVIGDQQAALAGQACFARRRAKNTYGTGCFLLTSTGEAPVESEHHLLTTIAWRRAGRTTYALEGGVFVGGAIVQWLRDGLGLIRDSSEIEGLARSVADSDGVYLVPALTGLGAPHWDPYARGAILGLTRGSTAGHIARAALEGICFEIADLLEAMERDAGERMDELRVDGGAAANDLMLQFQSDILQRPLVRPEVLETTAMGAAFMAGLATGVWKDEAALEATWRAERVFEPTISADEARGRRDRWAEAVRRAGGWAERETPP